MNLLKTGLAIACLWLANCQLASAQDKPFLDMLNKMPAGGNAVMVANLAAVRNSQVATKNGWFDSSSGGIKSGIDFLPDDTNKLAAAARLDFQTFETSWTSCLMTLDKMPQLDYIADKTFGKVDELGGTQFVVTGSDVVAFQAGNMLATFSPANRQLVAPWITSMKAGKSGSAEGYLASAVKDRGDASLVIAFDLNYLVSESAVMKRAEGSDKLKSAAIDPAQFSKVLASLQGAKLAVDFTDKIYADLRIQFGENPGILKPVGRDILLEVMQHHGAYLAEVENWDTEINDNNIRLTGELSQTGLRRLISLFDSPETQMTSAGSEPSKAEVATKDYFDGLTSMITELESDIGSNGQNAYKFSRWFHSFADRIDNLPMENVDPDVLDFGASVSQTFRDIAMQTTNTRESVDMTNSDLMTYGKGSPDYRYRRFGHGYRGHGYGYVYPWGYRGYRWGAPNQRSNAQLANNEQVRQERRNTHTKARADVSQYAREAFNNILNAHAELKRSLTEKYPDMFK